MSEKNTFIFFGIFVIWLALLISPYMDQGIFEIINNFSKIMNNPFEINFGENSIKTVLIFLLIYIFAIAMYYSTRKNYRSRRRTWKRKVGKYS